MRARARPLTARFSLVRALSHDEARGRSVAVRRWQERPLPSLNSPLKVCAPQVVGGGCGGKRRTGGTLAALVSDATLVPDETLAPDEIRAIEHGVDGHFGRHAHMAI